MEIVRANDGYAYFRSQRDLLHRDLAKRERALCDTQLRGFHELGASRRDVELRIDEFSKRKIWKIKILLKNILENFKNYKKGIDGKKDSKDLKDAGSVRSGPLSHVPSAPALFPLPTYPGGFLSSPQNTQPDSKNTRGISGNIFANSPAYSSAPCSRTLSSWNETAPGRIPMHDGAEKLEIHSSQVREEIIGITEQTNKDFKSRNFTLTGPQLHKRFRAGR